MDNSTFTQPIMRKISISNVKQLLHYFQQELPEGFWGNVIVKFKDGVPYLVEEQRQIKLDKAR